MDNVPDKLDKSKTDNKPVQSKKMPIWHEQQELILKKWSEIGSSYRYLHDKSFMKYNSQNLRFALPVIVISTITGTANFAQKSFPEAWSAYVPLGIGFLNLTAGLITTVAQFLRVSELLEGHRSASIAYSKFSRNISVELSLPVSQRTNNGFDFIVTCRTELDRLIEQSPNIPTKIVNEFAKRFNSSAFFKPDILDITPVKIYKNDPEAERRKKQDEFVIEQAHRRKIVEEEDEKKQRIKDEFTKQEAIKQKELTAQLELLKKQRKNTVGVDKVNDTMDKLLETLGTRRKNASLSDDDTASTFSTIVNDLINPSMEPSAVNNVINSTLNIPASHKPESLDLENSDTSSKTTEVHIEIVGSDISKKNDKDNK
jgi:hypothetical protein